MPINFHKKEPVSHLKELGMADVVFARLRGERVVCLLALYLVLAVSLRAGGADSIASRSSLFVIPHASYQQETSWAPGVAYGYYFKSRDLSRISSISGSVVYTLRHQFMFHAEPKLYFGKEHQWYLYSNLNVRKYPDYFYGVGGDRQPVEEAYTSRAVSVLLQPQYAVTRHFYVGPHVEAHFEHVKTTFGSPEAEAAVYDRYGLAGWMPYVQTAVGVAATFDSRDNAFYPYRGVYAKGVAAVAVAGWGSTYSVQQVSADVRHYFPLFKRQVLAVQLLAEGAFGRRGVPFQLLPTLGGRDVMRGFREGMYRGNLLVAAQAEYRFPLFWRFKGSVFCATGEVFEARAFRASDKWKFAYGAGIRCRVNDARVHVRFDIAKNNYHDKLQFYITATEAF